MCRHCEHLTPLHDDESRKKVLPVHVGVGLPANWWATVFAGKPAPTEY